MHGMLKGLALSLVLAVAAQDVFAAPLHILTVGDLHTTLYSGDRLRDSFYSIAIGVDVTNIAWETMSGSDLDDVAHQIPAADPDVVVLLLGLHDATLDQFDVYQTGVFDFLEDLEDYSATRPGGIQLLIAGNPPAASQPEVEFRLQAEYNPWLAQQAEQRDVVFVDFESRVRRIADWPSLYTDGLTFTDVGYQWVALTIRNHILALPFAQPVPEPMTWTPTAIMFGLWALLFRPQCSGTGKKVGRP